MGTVPATPLGTLEYRAADDAPRFSAATALGKFLAGSTATGVAVLFTEWFYLYIVDPRPQEPQVVVLIYTAIGLLIINAGGFVSGYLGIKVRQLVSGRALATPGWVRGLLAGAALPVFAGVILYLSAFLLRIQREPTLASLVLTAGVLGFLLPRRVVLSA